MCIVLLILVAVVVVYSSVCFTGLGCLVVAACGGLRVAYFVACAGCGWVSYSACCLIYG